MNSHVFVIELFEKKWQVLMGKNCDRRRLLEGAFIYYSNCESGKSRPRHVTITSK